MIGFQPTRQELQLVRKLAEQVEWHAGRLKSGDHDPRNKPWHEHHAHSYSWAAMNLAQRIRARS